jgi:hypothetical protein
LTFRTPVELGPTARRAVDVGLKIAFSVSLDVQDSGLSDPRRNPSAVVLTRKAIDALPEDPRLFMNRLLQMAGAVGRRGDVAVYVDGFREHRRLPPKRAIEMIRINSNAFSAEFSQPSAKRIEITTRPGSAGFHGDIRLQARSRSLDARNPLSDAKPLGDYLNVNGYIQGPLRKERLGVLVYAGRWQQDENAFVHATVVDATSGVARPFATTVSTPTSGSSVMVKTDFTILDQTINTSYTQTTETNRNQGLESGFDLPERVYERFSSDHVTRLWWTSVGASSINDARVEFTGERASLSARSAAPAIVVLDALGAGGNQHAGLRTAARGVQAGETFTVAYRTHVLKAGLHVEGTRYAEVDRTGFGGTFTFGGDVERDPPGAPLLDAGNQPVLISPVEAYRRTILGLPGYGPTQFAITTGKPEVGVTHWYASGFFLDDWTISRRVSLSYGIRQELQNHVNFGPNLAPRAALSWAVDAGERNTLRVGAGLFYSRVDPDITREVLKLDGKRQ